MDVTPKVKFMLQVKTRINLEKINIDSNEKLITTTDTLDDSAREASKN